MLLIYNKMEAIAKTRSVGGSLVVTIPSEIVKIENIQEGEYVDISIKKKRIDYFGALKGIGEFKEEDRMEDRL